MIGSGLKRGQEKWTTERGVVEGQVSELRGHLNEMYADIRGDPKALLSKLAEVDARYKVFVGPAPAPTPPQAIPSDKPKPDVDLGNGQMTYSVEGVEPLAAWKAQQLLNERLKPWEEREKTAQARVERPRPLGAGRRTVVQCGDRIRGTRAGATGERPADHRRRPNPHLRLIRVSATALVDSRF